MNAKSSLRSSRDVRTGVFALSIAAALLVEDPCRLPEHGLPLFDWPAGRWLVEFSGLR
jgi:hypothetical protein